MDPPSPSKSAAEDVPHTTLSSSHNQEMPEIGQESIAEPEKQQPSHQTLADERSRSPSRASSTFGDSGLSNRYSSVSSVSTATGLGSPLPQSSAQRFEPRKPETESEEQLPPSPTQRRLSPERPSSPTKGLGGFVQSAMLKRSDSVSKRWSAQLPSGLSRGNSVSSNRNSIAVPSQADTVAASSPKLERDAPSLSTHRPGSGHSEATVVHHNRRGSERPSTPPVSGDSNNPKSEEAAPKPSPSLHTRSSSTVDKNESTDTNTTSPMVSRTMDPRRWSPTKATWLESALNRPDTPRHKKQPSQTPSWVKDRQSRGSVDLGRNFKEVTPVGLMRSAPLGSHYKKPSLAGSPDLENLDVNKDKESSSGPEPTFKPKESEPLTVDTSMEKNEAPSSLSPEKSPENSPEKSPEKSPEPKSSSETTSSDQVPDHRPSPLSLTSTPNIPPAPLSARDPISPRPKPQSPAMDFRANLRRRETPKDDTPREEPEFKNVFGKLRKTETSNYVAPDELKDNILRGKAALNATGGPQKSPKVDELKETIMKQKEAVRTGGGLTRRNTAGEKDAPAKVVPEAIAKRQNLTKSSSARSNLSDNAPSSPSPQEPSTPLALQSQKSPSLSSRNVEDVESSRSPEATPAPDQPVVEEAQPQAANLDPPANEPIAETKSDVLEGEPKEDIPETKQEDTNEEANKPVRALPSENVAADAPAPVATEGTAAKGNKLAGRINPALAGLLSRGPPAPSAGPKNSLSMSPSGQSGSGSSSASSLAAPLTHMTKGRARGPKRRMPKSVGTPELSAPKGETLAAQSELPAPEVETPSGEPELSVTQPEPVAPKDELSASEPELATSEPEPSAMQPEPSLPKDEPLETQVEPLAGEPEYTVTQPEPFVSINEPSAEPEPPVAEPEPFAPKDEPLSTQPEPSSIEKEPGITEPEPSVTSEPEPTALQPEPEPSLPKGEPLETQVEPFAREAELTVTQPELSVPKDEPSVSPISEPEPAMESKPSILKGEPLDVQSEIPEAEPVVTEPEPSIPKDEHFASEPETALDQKPSIPKGEPLETQPEPFVFKDEPSPSLELDSTPPVDRHVGDSNSNWPLPDIQPAMIGTAQPSSSPSTERNLTETDTSRGTATAPNVTPQSKTRSSLFSRNSPNNFEDTENMLDTPPAVPPKQSPHTPTTARTQYASQSPSPLRTSYKENGMASPVGSPSQRTFAGFSLGGRNKSLPSPPVPPKRSDTQQSSPRSSSSLVPLADESMEFISDFFKTFPKTSDRVDIDPQLMLTSQSDDLKIHTVKKQIWEITSDGKRQDLPLNHEYILYEGSMYLSVHTFESGDNTRTETQLWCGDDVPDHAIDDTQSFSRKVAKENGCRLEIIKQGKETARFIHALGGILITRRGSNSRSSLSALYMLCGRKHLKQMVFDEVDFARRSLCSGFPFVISAPFGKLYLWKGKGSSAEEIGAARLIGMDLGLTGEFEEVMEGEEPESFFEIFNYRDTEDYLRSDDWQLKPNHDRFCCRLLHVNHELGQRSGFWIRRPGSSSPIIRPNDTVKEIEPFCLKDLSPKGIYILDAFFELYV